MPRVIMLLPNPDLLQLANCHKYVTRTGANAYSEIYTMTTIANTCAGVDKILVIGHGDVGEFTGTTVDAVASAIIGSGISLTGGKKVSFDTCYAGSNPTPADPSSALHLLKARLKARNPDCNLVLTGVIGPSITIGRPGAKRKVVKPAKLAHAGAIQTEKLDKHNLDFFRHRDDWNESAPSATIRTWAHAEYDNLIDFAVDFREAVADDLDASDDRKVVVKV